MNFTAFFTFHGLPSNDKPFGKYGFGDLFQIPLGKFVHPQFGIVIDSTFIRMTASGELNYMHAMLRGKQLEYLFIFTVTWMGS